MSDQEALEAFFIGCAIIFLLFRIVRLAKRPDDSSLPDHSGPNALHFCKSAMETSTRRDELRQFISLTLGVPSHKLDPNTDFNTDLRVPPVELDQLLGDVITHLGIAEPQHRISTVGQLLDLIQTGDPSESDLQSGIPR